MVDPSGESRLRRAPSRRRSTASGADRGSESGQARERGHDRDDLEPRPEDRRVERRPRARQDVPGECPRLREDVAQDDAGAVPLQPMGTPRDRWRTGTRARPPLPSRHPRRWSRAPASGVRRRPWAGARSGSDVAAARTIAGASNRAQGGDSRPRLARRLPVRTVSGGWQAGRGGCARPGRSPHRRPGRRPGRGDTADAARSGRTSSRRSRPRPVQPGRTPRMLNAQQPMTSEATSHRRRWFAGARPRATAPTARQSISAA